MSEGKTRPGQSHNLTVGVRNIVWKCLVWPGVFDTLTTCEKEQDQHLHKHHFILLLTSSINNKNVFMDLNGHQCDSCTWPMCFLHLIRNSIIH